MRKHVPKSKLPVDHQNDVVLRKGALIEQFISRWDSGGWPHERIARLKAAAVYEQERLSTWDMSRDPHQLSTTPTSWKIIYSGIRYI
jgi:hypothetical protein